MLEYITCGESHGKYLTAIIEWMPSGFRVTPAVIDAELRRRQQGYGRGGRMQIEEDRIIITGGIIGSYTTGAPIGLMIVNKDTTLATLPDLERPRPGHADFAGALKYDQSIRAVLERASARETALRVAVGAVCKHVLKDSALRLPHMWFKLVRQADSMFRTF